MTIQKFQQKDKDALITLWETIFPNNPPHNKPADMIEAKLAVDDLIFIAKEKGIMVGACMAGYDGHRGWLYAVAVLQQYRRGGTGAKLVKHSIAALKDMGCIKVNLQIRSTNTQVVAFYKSLGFILEDRISMGSLMSQIK